MYIYIYIYTCLTCASLCFHRLAFSELQNHWDLQAFQEMEGHQRALGNPRMTSSSGTPCRNVSEMGYGYLVGALNP